MYPEILLCIGGQWTRSADGRTIPVVNPATEEVIGSVAHAGRADLDAALAAAERGFTAWRKVSPYERSKVMRRAAELLRERAEKVAQLMTLEQGKPVAQSRMETAAASDIIEWMAEEGRRAYGRLVPGRAPNVQQMVVKEPVGIVAAFSPWNFPINQAVRKIAAALTTGCAIIIKAPEETPASPAELVRCFIDAGVPAGVVNLVYGVPAEISNYLIPHPTIRKISFTGSTAVGKHLMRLAADSMIRTTMELGGHAPVLVFADADIEAALDALAPAKARNAGQVCTSPTRFYVEAPVYERFATGLSARLAALRVGDGMEAGTQMGPLANPRRLDAMQELTADAVKHGATLLGGGARIGNKGYFWQPTVLRDVPADARIMNEEPFGPVAALSPFEGLEAALASANRLPFGLASYVFTGSVRTALLASQGIEAGMVGLNQIAVAQMDSPFGGVKESGHGSEDGPEGIEAYLVTKAVHQ